jgi:hypothetical protein
MFCIFKSAHELRVSICPQTSDWQMIIRQTPQWVLRDPVARVLLYATGEIVENFLSN